MISHLRFSDPTCSKLIADLFHQFRPMLINIIHLIPRQHGIQHYPMTNKSISRRFQPKPFSPTQHSLQPYRILCSRPHTLTYHPLPKDVYSTRVRLYVCLCAPRYAALGRNMTGIHPSSENQNQHRISSLPISHHPERPSERRAAGTSNLNFHKGAYFNTAHS